jgi:hypothetical protein
MDVTMRKDAWKKGNMLYRSISDVVSNYWDPLDLAESNGSVNSYEYYLPVIYNWALVANDKHDLATDLSNLACNQMGVLTTQPNVRKVAHLIIAIRDFHLKNTMSLTPNVPLKLRA